MRHGAWVLAAVAALAVAPVCEIPVELRPPPGMAMQDRTILLLDRSGFPIARTISKKGRAEFCGVAPFWFPAVRVGGLDPPRDCRVLTVVLPMDQECYGHSISASSRPFCSARIYIRDGWTNEPMANAVVTNPKGKEPIQRAESYFSMRFFDTPIRVLRVEAAGYGPVERVVRMADGTKGRG